MRLGNEEMLVRNQCFQMETRLALRSANATRPVGTIGVRKKRATLVPFLGRASFFQRHHHYYNLTSVRCKRTGCKTASHGILHV